MRPFLSTIIAHYPADLPLVALAGSGRFAILALRFSEIDPATALAMPLASRSLLSSPPGGTAPPTPFSQGLIGLLSYGEAPHRIFRVEQALVHDQHTGRTTVTGTTAPATWTVDPGVIARLLAALRQPAPAPAAPPPLELIPESTDAAYLALVGRALADIRAGRYYQINLLRYYRVSAPPDRSWLARRLGACGGPHAAWFAVPGLTVASFSPERFLQVTPDADGLTIEARPIKGTAPRGTGPAADAAAAAGLLASRKDLAELHMIVDLMRNDLHRVAIPGTVRVATPQALVTLPSVHHLEARVTARLAPGLRLGELVAATCPGGSITGAPKVEVMQAIRAYEGRARDYFMGNAFYLDDRCGFDSSILIRTLVQRADFAYAFAAGSGIVIGSEADTERREIVAKCGVVTAGGEAPSGLLPL